MNEKEIKQHFISDEHFYKFKDLLQSPQLRVYAIEFPIEIEKTKKYADIVLINEKQERFYDKQMFVLEFKKDHINYGPVDQLDMYVKSIHKRLYRRNKTIGILVAPSFSQHELKSCRMYGYHALQLDEYFNMRFLA